MKKGLEVEHDFFSAEKLGEIVQVNLKENLILRLTDLKSKTTILDYLDLVGESKSIKALIINASKSKSGRDEYLNFYQRLIEAQMDRTLVLRMYNAINQLILRLVELPKISIHVDSGRVIMMFLNLSLACDYRLIAEDTVFQNPCLELGMLPKGGGAFFLTRMLGAGKAMEILLSCNDITAEEAWSMGLVNQVTLLSRLEDVALETAQRFCQNPLGSICGIKRLINYSRTGLRDYLELENRELARIIDSGEMKCPR